MGPLSDKDDFERRLRNKTRRMKSTAGDVPLAELRVDADFWGEGAEPIVKQWLRDHYDRNTMPRLVCAQINGREGISLIGWDHDNTKWPALLHLIFGDAYADKRLELNEMGLRLTDVLDESGHGEYGSRSDRREN